MSDRGRFSGFNWHLEFHTVDKKKAKAADCIFLTTNRICQNKTCNQYLSKCFVATNCPFRIKSTEREKIIKEQQLRVAAKKPLEEIPTYKNIKCSIPCDCRIYSEKFGKGRFQSFDTDTRIVTVKFGEKMIRFKYPEAVLA